MHNHNSRTPGFGVFLGEAADGGGDGFPKPPLQGAVNRGLLQGVWPPATEGGLLPLPRLWSPLRRRIRMVSIVYRISIIFTQCSIIRWSIRIICSHEKSRKITGKDGTKCLEEIASQRIMISHLTKELKDVAKNLRIFFLSFIKFAIKSFVLELRYNVKR